jgi:hypothetical protein
LEKGETMKKQYLTAVLALVCLLGLGVVAQAQESEVITKVPFDFVAGGKTLPAGTYSVNRVSTLWDSHLIINNGDSAAFVLPIAFDSDSSAGQALLSFERVGDTYFLSKVKTPAGVYTIGTSRALSTTAQKKTHQSISSSGTN